MVSGARTRGVGMIERGGRGVERIMSDKLLYFFFKESATTEIYTEVIGGSVRCV